MLSKMKNQATGAILAPGTVEVPASERINALSEQVNNLQRRYYRALAPDCEVRTASDRWHLRAVATACFGLVFPPLFIVTALCVYQAKKCRKGGEA